MFHDRDTTLSQFGSKRERTREGFLYCHEVPIARVGVQDYLNNELPEMAPGLDGVIRVERRPEDVFAAGTIASFQGKDITDDHPDDFVGPENFKEHAVGTVLNPRRGEGALVDCLIADLLIKDADAIDAVEGGKREVSCGYDADYESLGPGRARQLNIVGNHVAIVDRGRCGHRCSIGDKEVKTTSWKDKFLGILARTTDAENFMAEVTKENTHDDEPSGSGVHVHIHGNANEGGTTVAPTDDDADPTEKRFKTLEGRMDGYDSNFKEIKDSLAEIAKGGKKDPDPDTDPDHEEDDEPVELQEAEGKEESTGGTDKKTKDASPLQAAHQAVVAGCEILVPGFKSTPTFDAKDRKKTADSLCLARRRALAAFARTKDGAPIIRAITSLDSFDPKMPCAELTPLFNAAVAMTKDRRANIVDLGAAEQPGHKGGAPLPTTAAQLNEAHKKFWEARK